MNLFRWLCRLGRPRDVPPLPEVPNVDREIEASRAQRREFMRQQREVEAQLHALDQEVRVLIARRRRP